MVMVKTPSILKKAFYSLVWDLKNSNREVFLTFDDGPHPDVTPRVTELLDKYQAHATFFVIGRNVERFPDVFEETVKAGHSVGNHTFSHLKGWITPNREYYADIELANSLIGSPLFRPPYGKITRSQFRYLRRFYSIIMWDVMTSDFDESVSGEKCLSNVIDHVKPGSIIVFHDSPKASGKILYSLPRALDFLKEQNYDMKAIPQRLLNYMDYAI